MKRTLLFAAAAAAAGCLLAGTVQAADGLTLGIGTDYSTGDYGSDTTTTIWSVPVTARFATGDWTFKATLPWTRVSGDPNVLPAIGRVVNVNPHGRGRGQQGGPPPVDEAASGSAAGIGDLTLQATRSFDTGSPLGLDLTAKAKVATADEDKGLGTGANDYGLAIDLYRAYGATTVFGGAGYMWLGDSDFIDVDAVADANLGFSRSMASGGSIGLVYDWRAAATDGFDDRSELTGFYGVDAGASGRVQFHATRGLSDGSPDWAVGVSYSHSL